MWAMLAVYFRERNSCLGTTMERLCANNAFLENPKYKFYFPRLCKPTTVASSVFLTETPLRL